MNSFLCVFKIKILGSKKIPFTLQKKDFGHDSNTIIGQNFSNINMFKPKCSLHFKICYVEFQKTKYMYLVAK